MASSRKGTAILAVTAETIEQDEASPSDVNSHPQFQLVAIL
jgi:hypothetical protein